MINSLKIPNDNKEFKIKTFEVDKILKSFIISSLANHPLKFNEKKLFKKTYMIIYVKKGFAKVNLYNEKTISVNKNQFIISKYTHPVEINNQNNFEGIVFFFNLNIFSIKNHTNTELEFPEISYDDFFNNLFQTNNYILKTADETIYKISIGIFLNQLDTYLNFLEKFYRSIELIYFCISLIVNDSKKVPSIYNNYIKHIQSAQGIIRNNVQSPPSIEELSKLVHLSKYHLQQGFKWATGKTVYSFIKQCKFEKASELLLNTDMSILEISMEVGYDNPSKFSKMFKTLSGKTPLNYRKRI